ncbi:GTPase [Alicycliphilus denitrificans]|uniref:GTPase n=1 Tax=Alicycliphilus denitrificans TaxID=179636 RepID=UPI003A8090CD
MGMDEVRSRSEGTILSVLPERAHDLARLRVLAGWGDWPIVTVVGKYNHGKSRLLNELIGTNAFAVADRRETVALSAHVHEQVRWLDAPGLDADVASGDDEHAHRAVWLESDIRLFVHAAKEGELDARERALLQALRDDGERTRRQTLFVLSQVDQLADEAAQRKVEAAIEAQAPGLAWLAVSSTRHRQGVDGAKLLLLEKSGIPALKAALAQALARVPTARAHEAALLLGEMRGQLQRLCAERQDALAGLRRQQAQQRTRFDQDLAAVLGQVGGDIQAVLDVPGPDHSLTPDSFADQFKMTPGKLERNRLQVAYSKACIKIGAILTRHGAMDLPPAQQTQVKSLDSVMVAVLGVSVKYRKDLQRLFCEAAGRAALAQDFTRYFELSADRQALAARIGQARSDAQAAERAMAAMAVLEAGA